MNAGTMGFDGSGRIKTTTASPTIYAPNAIPYNDGAICVAMGTEIANYASGLPYGPSGHLVIQTSLKVPVAYFHAGLGFTASGQLACDTTGEITHYVRALPMTREGRLAIQAPLKH